MSNLTLTLLGIFGGLYCLMGVVFYKLLLGDDCGFIRKQFEYAIGYIGSYILIILACVLWPISLLVILLWIISEVLTDKYKSYKHKENAVNDAIKFSEAIGINIDYGDADVNGYREVVLHNFRRIGHLGLWNEPSVDVVEDINNLGSLIGEFSSPVITNNELHGERMSTIDDVKVAVQFTDIRLDTSKGNSRILANFRPIGQLGNEVSKMIKNNKPLVFCMRAYATVDPDKNIVDLVKVITFDIIPKVTPLNDNKETCRGKSNL